MAEARVSRLGAPAKFLNDWSALHERAAKATFFQSPAWLAAWLDDAPRGTELLRIEVTGDTITGEDGTLLLGVAGRAKRRAPPLVGFNEARLHEFCAPAHDAIYVEYNDFLTVPDTGDDSGGARALALDALIDDSDGTDSFVFRNITPAMVEAVNSVAAQQEMDLRILSEQPVYVCDLKTPRAEARAFIDGLSSGLRADIRRSTRIYEERGVLGVRLVQTDAEKERAWAALIDLHSARWRGRGQAGAFSNRHFLAFHERLRERARQACHLLEITNGDKILGVLYNFIDGDAVRQYQTGFLYEDDKRLTPGLVCHALACQYYMDQGFSIYDFMAGDGEYKRRFGEQKTTLRSIALDRLGWRRKAYDVVKKLSGRA